MKLSAIVCTAISAIFNVISLLAIRSPGYSLPHHRDGISDVPGPINLIPYTSGGSVWKSTYAKVEMTDDCKEFGTVVTQTLWFEPAQYALCYTPKPTTQIRVGMYDSDHLVIGMCPSTLCNNSDRDDCIFHRVSNRCFTMHWPIKGVIIATWSDPKVRQLFPELDAVEAGANFTMTVDRI